MPLFISGGQKPCILYIYQVYNKTSSPSDTINSSLAVKTWQFPIIFQKLKKHLLLSFGERERETHTDKEGEGDDK